MAKTDRTILISNDQSFGQIADPNKMEAQIHHAFDKIDENDNEMIAHRKQVDPTSADETRDKHVSNKDLKNLQDQITTNDTASINRDNTHKNATVLDHPDQSVTTAKIRDLAVTSGKIATGAVGRTQLDPTLFEQTANAAKFQEIDSLLADMATVNVHSYGAKGDGVTDDTQAFLDAVSYAKANNIRKVYAPKKYLLNSTLDLTNLMTNGITIEGNNMSFAYGYGSEILLNTGGIGIDCTGSSRVVFRNLKITSRAPELTNPSKIGILFGRSTVNVVTGNCKLDNCIVDVISDWTANGGNGTIAIYNYATEVFKIDMTELKGDIPIVFTHDNLLNIQSSIVTTNPPNTSNTMTVVEVVGTHLTSRKSYACILQNTGEAIFKVSADCFPSDGTEKGKATFKMVGDYCKNIKIEEIHSEVFNEFIELEGKLDYFELTGLISGITDKVINMTTSTSKIRSGKINLLVSVDRGLFPTGSTALIYNSFSGDYQLSSLDINIGSSVKIEAPNQRLTSSKITSTETVALTEINVKTSSKYELLCWDGTPTAIVKSTSNQSLDPSIFTKVIFQAADINTGMYDGASTDRLTIKKPGIYMVHCYLSFASAITGVSILSVIKGGTTVSSDSKHNSGNYPRQEIFAIVQCNVNDVIQIEAYHTNATSVNIASGVNLRVVRIAP